MSTPVWQVPLDFPPQVVAIGRNAHGFVPVDRYRLDDLWSLHLYGYDARLLLDGREVAVHPGTLGVTPPGVQMETHYRGISVHLYAHFRLPPGPTRPVWAVTDTGASYEALYAELFDAVGRFTREPAWTSARVWSALWKAFSLSGAPERENMAMHRAVRRASDLIEQNLSGPLSVAELARQVEVAPSYLTRLFQEAYGESVVDHIRRRRMERASHLLLRSNLPIKIVASSVGFPDLQRFNKAVRQSFGLGPRALRQKGRLPAEEGSAG